MNKFFSKVQQFMLDRNGFDKFCLFLFVVYGLLVIINLFARSLIVLLIEFLIIGYIVFRMLSKNIYARHKENMQYLKVKASVINFFIRQKNRIRDIKTHRYIKCTHCKAKLRVKRRKGKHTVRCPKCHGEFEVNIRI